MIGNILITGATGNIGRAVLKYLQQDERVWRASQKQALESNERYFNFEDLEKSKAALQNLDLLFLLRPPQISDTKKYFQPLIQICKEQKVKHIVFLSVQGVEKSSIIPHNKIERMILNSGMNYTFLRPSYFMQNLTTTLKPDIDRGQIYLPAGNTKFLWIDADDIGKAIAKIIETPSAHVNKTYTLTGTEYFTFKEVSAKLTHVLKRHIVYKSPSLIGFIFTKMRQGVSFGYTLVLIMLHYLARFQSTPPVTDDFKKLTNQEPKKLDDFLKTAY